MGYQNFFCIGKGFVHMPRGNQKKLVTGLPFLVKNDSSLNHMVVKLIYIFFVVVIIANH